jgi:DNA-binding transcriptional LysR family regulator
MELSAIDTNLLLALHALLQEASVTRAAKRLAVGQPAMSHSLARLRAHFGDPLLVAKGRQHVLSPGAQALAPSVERAVAAVAEVFGDSKRKPASPGRPYVLACADHFGVAVLPILLRNFGGDTGGGLEIRPLLSRSTEEILEDADVALGAFEDVPVTITQRHLFSDSYVCVVRRDHPRVRKALTLETYLELDHIDVVPAPLSRPGARIDRALGQQARRRQVIVRVPYYILAARTVAQTDLVLTITRSLAELMQPLAPVKLVTFPGKILPHRFSLIWHRRNDGDAVHARFRNGVIEACKEHFGESG